MHTNAHEHACTPVLTYHTSRSSTIHRAHARVHTDTTHTNRLRLPGSHFLAFAYHPLTIHWP